MLNCWTPFEYIAINDVNTLNIKSISLPIYEVQHAISWKSIYRQKGWFDVISTNLNRLESNIKNRVLSDHWNMIKFHKQHVAEFKRDKYQMFIVNNKISFNVLYNQFRDQDNDLRDYAISKIKYGLVILNESQKD